MNEVAQEQAPAKLKGKAAAATSNLIADIASEVENLTKPKALNRLDKLAEDIETNYFILGGVLNRVRENGWFEGYETFADFVQERLGFQERKAKYLIEIYSYLVTNQIPWEKVKHLGWTKLKDIARFLTQDNVDEWVKKVEGLSYRDMAKMLKADSEVGDGKGQNVKGSSDTNKLTFVLKADQLERVTTAVAKAKGEMSTEYDSVALDAIANAYLGNAVSIDTSAPAKSLKELMVEAGWEQVLAIMEEAEMVPDNVTIDVDVK